MTDFLESFQTLFFLLSFLSLIFFLGSLLALPWFVGKLPEDYFVSPGRSAGKSFLSVLLRNALGGVVLLAGVVMLFIPGQGVLTMVVGLMLMDFPGRAKLIWRVSGFPKVRAGLNWLRRKGGRPPLIFPERNGE